MTPGAAGFCAGEAVADRVVAVGFIGYCCCIGVIGTDELIDVIIAVVGCSGLTLYLVDIAGVVELVVTAEDGGRVVISVISVISVDGVAGVDGFQPAVVIIGVIGAGAVTVVDAADSGFIVNQVDGLTVEADFL